jgi:hypothetical protein
MLDAFGRKSSFFHNTVRVQDAIFEGCEERLAEVRHDVVSALTSGSVLAESAHACGPFRFRSCFPTCLTPPITANSDAPCAHALSETNYDSSITFPVLYLSGRN